MAHTVAFPPGRFGLLFYFLITPTLTLAGVEPNSTGSLIGPRLLDNERAGTAVFEPTYGETTVRARLADRSCFFMRLQGKWQLIASGEGVSLRELRSEAEVDVALHQATAFTSTSGVDLAASYAAHLQRDYEELLGRPVTATALERVDAPGVYRWRATWSDSNFDNAARALSLERFIIQARPDAVIEVSFNGFEAREAIGVALATVELRGKTDCQFPHRRGDAVQARHEGL